jgi:inner membrane protein
MEHVVKNSVVTKTLAIVCVLGALILGLGLIQNLVKDRFAMRNSAIASIGSSQILTGPIIHSACLETWDVATKTAEGVSVVEERREFVLTALPESLLITSDAKIDQRARSLHQVNTFTLNAKISAKWIHFETLQAKRTVKDSRMNCGAPVVMVSVSDSSGIRSASLVVSGVAQTLKPGTFHPRYSRGVHAVLPDALRSQKEPLTAEIALELLGTEKLSIVPVGGTTEITMKGNWPHPSFGGTFLPAERTVSAQGFDGKWRISALATTVGDSLSKGHGLCAPSDNFGRTSGHDSCVETLSVSFVDPINFYSLSDRATKYGLLFVVLTFVAVGLFEFMQRLRVHPVQYFLVGSAICIFFLLLVSLSEQIGFTMAYAAAASACVTLLMYYASYMLGSIWRGLPFGAMTGLLYGLLYMLLQLEQTALAVGAVALFVVLAAVMVLTRKIDWYGLSSHSRSQPKEA